jgi:hypothetical protein
MGPKKIPESGYRATASVKGLPVPRIGNANGTRCAAPTRAAHTAMTAGCIVAGNASLLFIDMNILPLLTHIRLYVKNHIRIDNKEKTTNDTNKDE